MRIDLREAGAFLTLLLIWAVAASPAFAEDWQAIAPEDLTMTSEPKAPGAAAIYLYRQVDRDDTLPGEAIYERIKILSEAGRQYADIEIPFRKGYEVVRDVQARTIRPDGTIVKFDGTVFEKTIVKGRGVKYLAKTFALPDVRVGSIIEYRYRHGLESGYVFDSHWILSQALYTRLAKFSLVRYDRYALSWSWPMGLPPGTDAPKEKSGKIRLEARDIPAFAIEDDMPPENELRMRVDFNYLAVEEEFQKDPDVYWRNYSRRRFREVNSFVNQRRAMEQALAQIVAPGDSEDVKLHKIYERCQQIRNVSFERDKTEQEARRENLKTAKDVEDVWRRGYGDGEQVTWLFLALARAAGLQADAVLIPTRDKYFFSRRMMNPQHLNSNLVVVNLAGKDRYFDPGTAFLPFGMLPWHETLVPGLRLLKDQGEWIATPISPPSDSRVERRATLKLSEGGALEGKVTVTYTGLEAHWRRLEERDDDAAARRKYLEEQVKGFVPSGITVKLTNEPDWSSSAPTLVAEFDLQVPGWADAAGKRALMAVGLFGNTEKYQFTHAVRVHPLYFSFPYMRLDDITIELPVGWQVSSVPAAKSNDLTVLTYTVAVENKGQSVHIKRSVLLDLSVLQAKYYDTVRDFFQSVRVGDEEQIVLLRSPAKARP
jgi:hypothetical protein